MLRLNKKTEYALLALRVMGLSSGAPRSGAAAPGPSGGPEAEAPLVTAKEIASRYRLPETLLAKVLQTLKRAGIVTASKGSGGGYRLSRPLEEVSLAELFGLFDDHVGLVECLSAGTHQCQQEALCDIRGPLEVLGEALMEPLRALSVRALFDRNPVPRVETQPPRKPVFRVQAVPGPRVTPSPG
jgi:Rrf2 family protein